MALTIIALVLWALLLAWMIWHTIQESRANRAFKKRRRQEEKAWKNLTSKRAFGASQTQRGAHPVGTKPTHALPPPSRVPHVVIEKGIGGGTREIPPPPEQFPEPQMQEIGGGNVPKKADRND